MATTYTSNYEDQNPEYAGITAADATAVAQPIDATIADASTYNTSATSSWDQLGDMLSQDNKTMQVAAATGNQTSNARGLMNSSLGVEASQKAMVDAAQPFALQDAQTAASFSANQQTAENQSAINSQTTSNTGLLNEQEYANQSGLVDQAAEVAWNQLVGNSNLSGQQQAQLAAMDYTFKSQYTDQVNAFTEKITKMGLDAANQQSLISAYTSLSNSMISSSASLAGNSNVSDMTSVIDGTLGIVNSIMKSAATATNIPITFDY